MSVIIQEAGPAPPVNLMTRNIIRRNGGFQIWQRGAGPFALGPSVSAYTADGWYLGLGTILVCTVSQIAGLTNQSQYGVKILRNAGNTGTGAISFGFPLDTDEIFQILGQFVRLSAVISVGANYSMAGGVLRFRMRAGTGAPTKYSGGAGYVAETAPISVDQAVTTTPTRYQFTSPLIIPTNARQVEVQFAWIPVGTAGADDSMSIGDVQLEDRTSSNWICE